jgi:hypothetical protein
MNNYIDIIKNNIQLFNCIKLKFKDWYKIELWFKLDDKDFQELYFYQSIDLKTWKIIFTSKEYEFKDLYLLNKDIEILIYENLNHLNDILEKHLNINN